MTAIVVVMRNATIIKHALLAAVACAGCLAVKLRQPVEDHRVQLETIAGRCAAEGGGPELCSDVAAMAEQACLLDAIVDGVDGAACLKGGE